MVTSNPVKRKYPCSDVIMLTSLSTIVELAIENEALLAAKRPGWAPPYFAGFKAKIDQIVSTHLGIDSAKDLRNATATLYQLQAEALEKLGDLNEEIKQCFKAEPVVRNELFTTLGFKEHYPKARKRAQDALIGLLFTFDKNATVEVEAQLTAKGIDANLATTIKGYCVLMKNANVKQETFKSNRKGITAETINTFNALYEEGVQISKLSARYTRSDKTLSQSFSFAKLAKAQKAAAKLKKQPPEPTPSNN